VALVPWSVYVELVAAEHGVQEPDPAKISELILTLVHAAWEQPPRHPSAVPVDGLVTGHPGGACVTVRFDGDGVQDALLAAADLGRHLCDAAPALLGWRIQRVGADRLD
jgi:hypothetical protein